MLPNRDHGARLRSLFALAGMSKVADLIADAQLIKALAHDAVAMHVDLLAIGCGDKTVTFFGKQLDDFAVIHGFVGLGLAAGASKMVLELAAHGIEGVADRDVGVLVRVVLGWITFDDDLTPSGNRYFDSYVKNPPLAMVAVC